MRIGLVTDQIFRYGSYGGYGFAFQSIAKGLAQKKQKVFVLTNKISEKQKERELVDDYQIITMPIRSTINPFKKFQDMVKSKKYFRVINADIYQYCNITSSVDYGMKAEPKKKHIINFQDPRGIEDWKEISTISQREYEARGIWWRFKFAVYFYKKIIKKADALTMQAHYLKKKVEKDYGLKNLKIDFMPNPIEIPKRKMRKSPKPLVVFLGRLDPIKRPVIFFELAKFFSDVDFYVLGESHHPELTRKFINKYRKIKNLKFFGWVLDEKKKSKILEKSWILINTSVHECLPVSFLEAWAHKSCVLSCQNPDNLVENYGYYVGKILGDGLEKINLFVKGLKTLLKGDLWKEKAFKGFNYVKRIHEKNKVIKEHIQYYKNLLEIK